MKKRMVCLLILILLIAVFPAMAEESKSALAGKWAATNAQDIEYFPVFQYQNTEKSAFLYLTEDGISLGSFAEDDKTQHVVISDWNFDGQVFTVDTDVDWMEFGYDAQNNTISLTVRGWTLYYEKTDDALQPGNPADIVDISDYYGPWRYCGYDANGYLDFNGILGTEFDSREMALEFVDGEAYLTVQSKTGSKNVYWFTYTGFRLENGVLYMSENNSGIVASVRAFDNDWIGVRIENSENSTMNYYKKTYETGFGGIAFSSPRTAPPQGDTSVRPQSEASAASPDAAGTRKVRIKDGSAPNVRSIPSTEGQKLGNARSGQTYELLDEQDGWYKIRLDDGSEGWIAGRMAQPIN